MEHNEYERKLRYRMCILTALESLLICCLAINSIEKNYIEKWELLHYHYHSPSKLVYIFIVPAASFILPAAFTLLSVRFKWFYRIYESLHFILGTAMLMFWLFDVYIWEISEIYFIIDDFYYIILRELIDHAAAFLGLHFFLHSRICIYLVLMLKAPSKGQM